MEYGIWNMEYGIWNMEYGIWNMQYAICNMQYAICSIELEGGWIYMTYWNKLKEDDDAMRCGCSAR
jgi:hypothetical protein